MRYEGQIYRPPGEWRSYLLQCTIGCSHNKCTFCGMYKTKKFHVRPMKEIIEDIAMAREYYGPENVDKVFLCDGDAIVMRQAHLLQILEALYAAFPHLRQVTVYAGTRSTMTKSQEQLIELRQAGLTRAYLGVESGWDELLKKVNKGVTSEQMLQAAALLKNAGIDLWVTVILGLAGPGEPSKKHVEETIRVLNRMQANHVSCLSYMPEPNSPMYQDVNDGTFPDDYPPGVPGGDPGPGGRAQLWPLPFHQQPRLQLSPPQGNPAGRPGEVPVHDRQRSGGEAADSQRIFPRPLTPAKKSKTHGGFCPPWVFLCQKENNMRYVGTIETGKRRVLSMYHW